MKREPGLDLLRCLGAFLVVAFHGNLYVGYQSEPQVGFGMWAANSFYHLTVGCNGIFLMISGYLHSMKPWNRRYYRGLFGVILGYVLASAVSIPVRHFFLGQEKSLEQWISAFLGFSGVYYGWYVEMYLGLMLISPVVNLAVKNMTDRQMLFACVSLVFVTTCPLVNYWSAGYPLAYYVMGAAVRRLKPRGKPWVCLALAGVLVCVFGIITLVSAGGGALADGHSQTFGGLGSMVLVLLLFLGLYQVSPGEKTVACLKKLGAGSYEGYLLSHLLDAWTYRLVHQWHTPEKYWLVVLFVTIPVFFLSMGMGRVVHGWTEKIKPLS